MDHRVECAGRKGQSSGGGHDRRRPSGELLCLGAVLRLAEAFEGDVGEHDLAAGPRGQVQAGPAAAGAEVAPVEPGTQQVSASLTVTFAIATGA